MISIEEAWHRYQQCITMLPSEPCPVARSLHRVLANDVMALTDLPRFDQSAMDGYALCAADTGPGTVLHVTQQAAAGSRRRDLLPGNAARILTGAPVPLGADTVIPQEIVRRDGDNLHFEAPYPAGKNVRYQGEEMRVGDVIALRGTRVTPGLLSALVNADVTEVSVQRQPRIAVLVTGDEVVATGQPRSPWQITDSNGPLVCALLTQWGFAPPAIHHSGDDSTHLRNTLAGLLDSTDLVITTGGASVGDRDYLPEVASSLSVEQQFWKVAQKPGKPLWFGMRNRTALLALPGNPGAVLVGMLLHVRRVLDLMGGQQTPGPQFHTGVLATVCKPDGRRVSLSRMRLAIDAAGRCELHSLPGQDSHMLGNLAHANVLAWLPAGDTPLAAGTLIQWMSLDA